MRIVEAARRSAVVFRTLLFFGALLALAPTGARAFVGEVVGVSDGDTITVLEGRTAHKVRLFGVDTPEKHQPFGTQAKKFTSETVFRKQVEVEPVDTDRYGRTVGIVRFGGRSLNEELVRAGMAWVYLAYCKRPVCDGWKAVEKQASARRVGLWKDPHPVPPWEFRRAKRR